MPIQNANAYPRKHFFFEMFTRDISLEDCILDLIDNSIDGLIRSRSIEIGGSLLNLQSNGTHNGSRSLPKISVSYSPRRFEIIDTCGGISRDLAVKDVFNFGHAPGEVGGSLGVYGIGLKRAIFKLGSDFEMISKTEHEGFSVNLDVQKWSEKDDKLEDWRIPLRPTNGAGSRSAAGTTIRITKLRPEVMMRMKDGVFDTRLRSIISQTYGLFIGKYVQVTLNGKMIGPFHIPIGDSDEVTPALDEYREGEVRIKLFASLAARVGPDQKWPSEPAGWYALCNGRVVVAADKTELTGWGTVGFPQFHDGKHRGFVGVAFFESQNPLALPWTTTKRGLNRESPVYLHARNRMVGVARPIIRFLDSMYGETPEDARGRAIANEVKQTGLAQIAAKPPSPFSIRTIPARRPRTTIRVQYDAEKSDVERIRNHIRRPSWGANQIGKYTFDNYLKTECPK